MREAIAARIVRSHFVCRKTNPADILSKHWDVPFVWPQLQDLLFWQGNAADLPSKDTDAKDVKAQAPSCLPSWIGLRGVSDGQFQATAQHLGLVSHRGLQLFVGVTIAGVRSWNGHLQGLSHVQCCHWIPSGHP